MQRNGGLELPVRDQAGCELSVSALSHEMLLELCCWPPRHVLMGLQDSVNSLIKWEREGDRKYHSRDWWWVCRPRSIWKCWET